MNVCYSVCMTAVSTTLAIGFLPLNMFIYSRFWVDDMTRVPYVEMVVTVIYVWTSVICDYFIGRRWPQFVPFLTQVCSYQDFCPIFSKWRFARNVNLSLKVKLA